MNAWLCSLFAVVLVFATGCGVGAAAPPGAHWLGSHDVTPRIVPEASR